MTWGGVGGVVGFASCLLGSVVGILVAGFVGWACGKRAAKAGAGETSGAGALAGLIGGTIAAPVFVVGASAGAIVAGRAVEMRQMSAMLSDMLATSISPEEAWRLFLLAVVVAAVLQVAVLVSTSVAAGAWASRKRERPES